MKYIIRFMAYAHFPMFKAKMTWEMKHEFEADDDEKAITKADEAWETILTQYEVIHNKYIPPLLRTADGRTLKWSAPHQQ